MQKKLSCSSTFRVRKYSILSQESVFVLFLSCDGIFFEILVFFIFAFTAIVETSAVNSDSCALATGKDFAKDDEFIFFIFLDFAVLVSLITSHSYFFVHFFSQFQASLSPLKYIINCIFS